MFDQQVADMTRKRMSTSDTVVEMRQYMQCKIIAQKENPLLWLKQNCNHYPKLQHVAMKYLYIPGNSIPAERLFSKAGELASARRNRLKPKQVNTYLF